jgi:hypothetical protein
MPANPTPVRSTVSEPALQTVKKEEMRISMATTELIVFIVQYFCWFSVVRCWLHPLEHCRALEDEANLLAKIKEQIFSEFITKVASSQFL